MRLCDVAERCGTCLSNLGDIELGRSNPSLDLLQKLLDELGFDFELTRKEETK